MKLFIVDAFTDRPFAGNPAAVCLLEEEREADWMQSVATEMNLSETAFVRPLNDGFELRWFTPAIEVELCGHATLASAHALWTEGVVNQTQSIRFHTNSGVLTCTQDGGFIELDFPATPAHEAEPPAGLLEALGIQPSFVGKSKFDKFLVVESEQTVRSLKPDFAQLRQISMRGVIVTSTSDDPLPGQLGVVCRGDALGRAAATLSLSWAGLPTRRIGAARPRTRFARRTMADRRESEDGDVHRGSNLG